MWTLHSALILHLLTVISSWLCAGEWNSKKTRRWHHRQHCQSNLQVAPLYHLIWIEIVLKISVVSSSSSSNNNNNNNNCSLRNLLFLIIANKMRFTQLIPVPSVSSMISGASKRHQIEIFINLSLSFKGCCSQQNSNVLYSAEASCTVVQCSVPLVLSLRVPRLLNALIIRCRSSRN